jgi:hypothetical protein
MSVKRALRVVALVAVLALHVPEGASASPYVVRSERGSVLSGYLNNVAFPDGSVRAFEVLLVVPQGSVTAGPMGGVDLGRPWVATTVSLQHDAEYNNAGLVVCSTVANPSSWSAGALDHRDHATGAWHGAFVDVRCDDGAGYDFYRVAWDPGPYWWRVNAISRNWAQLPLYPWSGGGLQGTWSMAIDGIQTTHLVVCGYRAGAARSCVTGTSGGSVRHTQTSLTVTAV